VALATKYLVAWIQKGKNTPIPPPPKKEREATARFEELDVTVLLDGGSLIWSLKIPHEGLRWFIAQILV
jgi:hypothetical protein